MLTIAADRDLFARVIISAKSVDINLREVLSYELSTFPHLLAHADGTLKKTTKSAHLTELEKEVDVQPKLPSPTEGVTIAYMMDGIASVQMMKKKKCINIWRASRKALQPNLFTIWSAWMHACQYCV